MGKVKIHYPQQDDNISAETKAMYGLGDSATPDDVLQKLSGAGLLKTSTYTASVVQSFPKNIEMLHYAVATSSTKIIAFGGKASTNVASTGYYMYSSDGKTFTEKYTSLLVGVVIKNVMYTNNMFIVVGYISGSSCFVCTSTDGMTWTKKGTPGDYDGFCIRYLNGQYVLANSGSGAIYTSTDLMTFTYRGELDSSYSGQGYTRDIFYYSGYYHFLQVRDSTSGSYFVRMQSTTDFNTNNFTVNVFTTYLGQGSKSIGYVDYYLDTSNQTLVLIAPSRDPGGSYTYYDGYLYVFSFASRSIDKTILYCNYSSKNPQTEPWNAFLYRNSADSYTLYPRSTTDLSCSTVVLSTGTKTTFKIAKSINVQSFDKLSNGAFLALSPPFVYTGSSFTTLSCVKQVSVPQVSLGNVKATSMYYVQPIYGTFLPTDVLTTINLGFTPSRVLISYGGAASGYFSNTTKTATMWLATPGLVDQPAYIVENGFAFERPDYLSGIRWMTYLAFRA